MSANVKQPSEAAMRAAVDINLDCFVGAEFPPSVVEQWAAIIDRHLERERDELAACKSLRCELVTIFGLPPERTGATWNERMLGHIGTHLAAVEQERQEVRQVLSDMRFLLGNIASRGPLTSIKDTEYEQMWPLVKRAESLLAQLSKGGK